MLEHLSNERQEKQCVLLLGNPNAGKTLLFNKLTKSAGKVGNYPGVTFDCKSADLDLGSGEIISLIDLPGTYSLIPKFDDEITTVKAVLGYSSCIKKYDLIVVCVDATNIERNLYMVSQLQELAIPFVIALTMYDLVQHQQLQIDVDLLKNNIGAEIIPVSSVADIGIDDLIHSIKKHIHNPIKITTSDNIKDISLSDKMLELVNKFRAKLINNKFLTDVSDEKIALYALCLEQVGMLKRFDISSNVEKPNDLDQLIHQNIQSRYKKIKQWTSSIVKKAVNVNNYTSLKIDRFLLHKFFGPLTMVAVFFVFFQILIVLSAPLVDLIGISSDFLSLSAAKFFSHESLLGSLIVDGIFKGVGSIIAFLPLIGVLFFCLGVLEDCGYLARVSFMLDKLLTKVGLQGRSFVPILSGFACAVPAIMSTKAIVSRRERLLTMMIIPFMSCSARLPVYGLMIVSLFSGAKPILGFIEVGALLLFTMYSIGIIVAIAFAWLLNATILKGSSSPLVLELPSYKVPRFKSIFYGVLDKCKMFIKEVGTVILAMTIVMWGLLTFPLANNNTVHGAASKNISIEQTVVAENNNFASIKNSYAGQLGTFLEPALKPLGFDWKIAIGIVASFAAREVLVSTLGVIYGLGSDISENSQSLKYAIVNDKYPSNNQAIYTPLVALSLMIFFSLALQCMSTLAIIKKETNSYWWPIMQFGCMTTIAWLASFTVYQGGLLLGFS